MMKTYRNKVMAATAALGGLVLLATAATAHGPGQNAGRIPYVSPPGAMGGHSGMTGRGGMMGPGYGGTMGPGGYGGMMGPGYGGTMGPGATQAPQAPCVGQGSQNSEPCGSGSRDAFPHPQQQILPFWQ